MGLGRGLDALMSATDIEVGETAPDATLPISKLKANKAQPRKNFDEKALEELTDSIRQNGILQPLLVRKQGNSYQIVAGERRYLAAQRAGLEEVPVVIREISDEDVFRLALIENLQRADLNPIEEAQGYKTLLKQSGMTQEALGRALSKSRSAIANTMRLLDLPDEVQQMMVEGLITSGHARAILSVGDEEGRIRLARRVVEGGLTVRQTESLAPLISVANEPRQKRQPTPQSYKRAAHQLRQVLGTNVRVKRVRNRNKIEIEFADEETLARIVSLIGGKLEGEQNQNEE